MIKKFFNVFLLLSVFSVANCMADDLQEKYLGKVVSCHDDLSVTITRCEYLEGTCEIDLILENTGNKDIQAIVQGGGGSYGSVAYDNEANEYKKDLLVKVGAGDLRVNAVNANLLSTVPVKARIQINNVSKTAEKFRRIDIKVICYEWGDNLVIKILNLPIYHEEDTL